MRYIDDLLFIWDGSETEFLLFTDYLNTNSSGLNFTGELNSKTINYLDLILFTEGDKVLTKTYFKQVDCNSLLDFGW